MSGIGYQTAGPHISWEAFDDEYVILDLNNGRYFSCAGGAAIVWRAILAGHDPAELSRQLSGEHAIAERIAAIFEAMSAAGLLRADGVAAPAEEEFLNALRGAQDDWRFESFDDLAALLVADPIHETDREAGWPHQPDHP